MRKFIFAAAGVALLVGGGLASSADAQERCHNELVKASGKATILGIGRARRLAIDNWQREVRQKFGERFMDFTNARQARHECESASIGTFGQFNKRCSVSAYPCATGSIADDNAAVQDGNSTFMIQRLLRRLDYLERDQVDGEFGPITRRAVMKFQRDEGLRVTGEPDGATIDRLRAKAERRLG